MLRDRYYIGYVRFSGNEYTGRHPHLIPLDLFHRVQESLTPNPVPESVTANTATTSKAPYGVAVAVAV